MSKITLDITDRYGPANAIVLIGKFEKAGAERYIFDCNLDGGHALKPGHRATLDIDKQGHIVKVITVVDAANNPVSLEEPLLASSKRAMADEAERKLRAQELENRRNGWRPSTMLVAEKQPSKETVTQVTVSTGANRPVIKPGRITSTGFRYR